MSYKKYEDDPECPKCGCPPESRRCHYCATAALITECVHSFQPRPIHATDNGQRWVCFACEAYPGRRQGVAVPEA